VGDAGFEPVTPAV